MKSTSQPAHSGFVAVVGHGPTLLRSDGAATILEANGFVVRTLDVWDRPDKIGRAAGGASALTCRAAVYEAIDRPDLAVAALRSHHACPTLTAVPAIVALSVRQLPTFDAQTTGFRDFVLFPYVTEELVSRVRALARAPVAARAAERHRVGELVVDGARHEVTLSGRSILLTAKELSLLAFLCRNRGRVVPRQEISAEVWGHDRPTGTRTLDIHVRRLRAKLGDAFPLRTFRGVGYGLFDPAPSDPGSPGRPISP